ncbi:MAG: hypothetical protein WEB63_08280 [Cucumibacter sp.]
MMEKISLTLRAIVLAAALGLGLAGPALGQVRLHLPLRLPAAIGLILNFAQAGLCFSNPQIQASVVSGQILPLAALLAQAGIGPGAQVLSAKVCETGQGPVYFVSVLDAYGEARNIALNAIDGSPYSGE